MNIEEAANWLETQGKTIEEAFEGQTCEIQEEHVHFLEWDGTVERFNKIVDFCFPEELYLIRFMDDNLNYTNKFTENFCIYPSHSFIKINKRFNYIGHVYKKGSLIQYDCVSLRTSSIDNELSKSCL